VSDGARGGARAPGYYHSGARFGRDRGVAVGFTAEPGLTPWAAASTAPAVGSRRCAWVHGGGRARSGRPRTWCLFPPPPRPRDRTRGSRPWRGRGGVNWSNAAAASYVRGKGPRLNLAPGIDMCSCWGAQWRGASGLRGDARECKREREREHDRLGAHGGQRRHGKARPRERRASTKATAPAT
jgi:hypothetical protein